MSYAEKIISDDFVWNAVMDGISHLRKRRSNTHFVNICCPMCVLRGEKRPDTKFRCGIKNNQPGVGINCYNCGFRTKQNIGQPLANNVKEFLSAVGMADIEIKRLAHRALQIASLVQSSPEAQALANIEMVMQFPARALPPQTKSIDVWAAQNCTDPDFIDAVNYLFSRGSEMIETATFYWTPWRNPVSSLDKNLNRRIIIPYLYQGQIVGYSARAIDRDSRTRYYNDYPQDYLFNADMMADRKRRFIILVEGAFDALAVDGVGTLGARLNDKQAMWINSYGKEVILVPDRDKDGDRMIDTALKYGWKVAFPALGGSSATRNWWSSDVKDCAKAAELYGRFYTLTSVLKSATGNAMEINMKRKLLV
jgi:hypothetical protein